MKMRGKLIHFRPYEENSGEIPYLCSLSSDVSFTVISEVYLDTGVCVLCGVISSRSARNTLSVQLIMRGALV